MPDEKQEDIKAKESTMLGSRKGFYQLLSFESGKLEVVRPNFIRGAPNEIGNSQRQTRDAFSHKWKQVEYDSENFRKSLNHQKKRYLDLYGFKDEAELRKYLRKCSYILDSGAGKCAKAAWFAELSPSSIIVAADISESLYSAAEYYKELDNLLFIQCDIAQMYFFADGLFDYVSCDQVIHHTADPYRTFQELVRLAKHGCDISCYVYRKKALPRELLDDYFREYSKKLSHDDLIALSKQLTELGRILSSLDMEVRFPDIPLLGIEGGEMTIQRFLYWNFIKCFWNDGLGFGNSLLTNYDWYSPSQAFRYTEEDFKKWIELERLEQIYFHKEKACYSGRFRKVV